MHALGISYRIEKHLNKEVELNKLLVYIIEAYSIYRALYLRLIGLKEIISKEVTDSTNKFIGLGQ